MGLRFVQWLCAIFFLSGIISAAEIHTTDAEAAFIREHPVWRMAGASSPPFQWTDGKGKFLGLASDYRRIIEERLGIQLQIVPAQTWDASLAQLRKGECDVSLLTSETPARREFLAFTKSLLDLPLVLIGRRGESKVSGIAQLAERRVAVARGWPIHEKLEREYPKIHLMPRDDVGSAISAVALGDADYYVGDLASATDAIERLGVQNLQIVGETEYVFPFCVGARKDWPEAVALIDKVIASISPKEHQAIRRKWIGSIDGTWTLKRVLTITLPTAIGFAILTLLIANRRLAREVAHRKDTEAALRESEQRWAFALDGSRNGVWDWDVMTNDVFFSQRFRTILGFEEGELGRTLEAWRSRLHPDDARAVLGAIHAHLRGETAVYEVEHRIQAKDGTYRWVLSRGRVVSRDEEGKPTRVVGTQSDITERKEADLAVQSRLEETVRARTEELQRVEQKLKKITDTVSDAV